MVKKLQQLCQKIDKNELKSFELVGFKFPNNFSVNELLELCTNSSFDRELCNELCFAINESEANNIGKLSFYNKIFLIYILFKCNKLYDCWYSEEFYLLLLKTIINANNDRLQVIYEILDSIEIETKEIISVFELVIIILKSYIVYKINKEDDYKTLLKLFESFESSKIDDFENSDIKEYFFDTIVKNSPNNFFKKSIIRIYKNIGLNWLQ